MGLTLIDRDYDKHSYTYKHCMKDLLGQRDGCGTHLMHRREFHYSDSSGPLITCLPYQTDYKKFPSNPYHSALLD